MSARGEVETRQARRWFAGTIGVVSVVLAAFFAQSYSSPVSAAQTTYVIHISVDGLGSAYLDQAIATGYAKNFKQLQKESSWTHNARADYDITLTLPNHASQLTGRPVSDTLGAGTGHGWSTNATPPLGTTLHTNRGAYVNSIFDVVHDNGLSTSLYATKDKFILFENSYNAANGAADVTGTDNGTDKIDTYVNNELDSASMLTTLLSNLQNSPTRYTFVHFHDADTTGHAWSWGGQQYYDTIFYLDERIGAIMNLVKTNAALVNNTTVIITADHGGTGYGHGDSSLAIDYTVPFYVWGPGIPAGADLYGVNGTETTNPGTGRPNFNAVAQPIHNADAANCALRRLGLSVIPGSNIDNMHTACGNNPVQPTSTATATSTSTSTPTPTSTATATATSTSTSTPTPTSTSTATSTSTPTPTSTATSTSTPTPTAPSTATPTATSTVVGGSIGVPGEFVIGAVVPQPSVSSSVTVSWNTASGATSYLVCVDEIDDGMCDTTPQPATPGVQLSGLTPGKTYFLMVWAQNANGLTAANAGTWMSFTVPASSNVYLPLVMTQP